MKSARGFTLLEVLLAMTLLAAGLALAFATLKSSTAMVARGEQMAQRDEHQRAVEGFLRRSLQNARPITFAKDDTGKPKRFLGEPQRLRFVADLPDYLGVGGPHQYDLQLVDAGSAGKALQVVFAMLGASTRPQNVRAPDRLSDDLTSASFAYRGLDAQGKLEDWQSAWPHPEVLPLQVRIEITSREGAWPPLIVSLPQATPLLGPSALPFAGARP